MISETLKEILSADFPDVALKKSGLSKTDIKPLADQGNPDAQLVLLLGLSCNAVGRIWTEDFEDEDTHKMIPIERWEHLDSPLFSAEPGEKEALNEAIASSIPSQTNEKLKDWAFLFDRDALYPAIYEELARRGDVEGLVRIGAIYAEGFESAGYKIDKEKAREFFDRALEAGWEKSEYDWNIEMLDYTPLEHPQDLADDFDPRDAIIMISGHPLYIDQIEHMLENLTKAHGLPYLESDYAVPLQYVFKTLGFDWVENTGNLIRYTRHSEPVLTMDLECNPQVDEALVEALLKAYPKATVEIIDNSPGA